MQSSKLRQSLLILLGGLLLGLAASVPLAVVWPYATPPPPSICENGGMQTRLGGVIFPIDCPPAYMFTQPPVWGSWALAGASFGLIARQLSGHGSRRLVSVIGAGALFAVGFAGSQAVDTLPNPDLPRLPQSDIALPFTFASFGVALTLVLAVGLALRTRGLLWRTLAAAAITGAVYFAVTRTLYSSGPVLLANRLPALGRPMGPMSPDSIVRPEHERFGRCINLKWRVPTKRRLEGGP